MQYRKRFKRLVVLSRLRYLLCSSLCLYECCSLQPETVQITKVWDLCTRETQPHQLIHSGVTGAHRCRPQCHSTDWGWREQKAQERQTKCLWQGELAWCYWDNKKTGLSIENNLRPWINSLRLWLISVNMISCLSTCATSLIVHFTAWLQILLV